METTNPAQPIESESGLRFNPLGPLLEAAYGTIFFRPFALSLLRRLEGGSFYSGTLRRCFSKFHGVRVGAYSYGECFVPHAFPRGVNIGRYVSIATGVRIYLRNHPMDRLSTHPFFFNSELGVVKEDSVPFGSLAIGHDAWIGANAIILPGCSRIGLGAVVGAGAVVTKDVPDFAVVVGNPARVVRLRFAPDVCDLVKASQWWLLPVEDCVRHLAQMTAPLGEEPWQHPLVRATARQRGAPQAQATAR